jgi:hypothetical protein
MEDNSIEYYQTIELHIRWSDRQDLILQVSPSETVSDIKKRVHSRLRPRNNKRRLTFSVNRYAHQQHTFQTNTFV